MTEHVSEDLTALLDGELSAERRDEVQAHLSSCPACAAERDLLATALGRVAAVPPVEPGPDLRRKVLLALDQEAAPRTWGAFLRGLLGARVLVPSGVAVAAGLLLYVSGRPVPEAGVDELEIAERLELLQDFDVVSAAPAGVNPEDLLVVAQLHELEVGE